MATFAIGEFLVGEGIITEEQLGKALDEQKRSGKRLGDVLIGLGFIDEEAMQQLVAMHHDVKYVDLNTETPEMDALKLIPREMVKKYQALPFSRRDGTLTVVVADPSDTGLVNLSDHLKHGAGLKVEWCMSTSRLIREALEKYFQVVPMQALD